MIFDIRKLNDRKFRKKKPRFIETRNLSKYDKKSFRKDLSTIDWQTILNPVSENPNTMVSTFQEIFELVLDIHAPLKRKRVCGDYAPWLNQSMRDLMRKRHLAKRAAVKSPEKWCVYKQLRNAVTKKNKTCYPIVLPRFD